MKYKISLMLLSLSFFAESFPWEKQEHQILADMAFDSTLSFCGINFTDSLILFPGFTLNKFLWNDQSFGNISAFFSGDDISQSRCHIRGHTILQQLEQLSANFIDKVWNEIKDTPEDIQSVEVSDQSTIFNYLLHHLIALRFARLSSQEDNDKNEMLRYAFIYEAAAQSYLSDSFSSGHLLLQVSDFLAPLNYMNIQITHDYYCSEGVYVINSQGECWQAFGDKLLQWYPYSFSRVFEACCASLRELFLVYYASLQNIEIPENLNKWARSIADEITPEELMNKWLTLNDGAKYYFQIKMPSLLYIPMPVSATWSVRTEKRDEYGIFQRKHYSQLLEKKFHDPDLNEIDEDFLYSRDYMPDWMIPGFLPSDTLQNMIKYEPDVASVRYLQDRYIPPSYQGYLLSAGGAYVFTDSKEKFGTALGLGWGFSDEFLFILIKPAFFVSALKLFDSKNEWILMTDLGFGINVPVFRIMKPHIEIGYAYGFQLPFNGSVGKFSLGFDSETIPLGFTYAGLTIRLKYQFIFFNTTLHSPVLEIILH